jgi:hypothetical protein
MSLPLANPRGSAATVQHKHMQHKPYTKRVALFTGNLKQRVVREPRYTSEDVVQSHLYKRVQGCDWMHVGHGSVVGLDDHGNEH